MLGKTLSEREHLDCSSNAGPVRIKNLTHTVGWLSNNTQCLILWYRQQAFAFTVKLVVIFKYVFEAYKNLEKSSV